MASKTGPDPSDRGDITVETLKSPPPHVEPAPLSKRVGACVVDSLIIGVISWPFTHFGQPFDFAAIANVGYFMVVGFIYYVILETSFASSVGKRLMRLHVVREGGDPVSLKESVVRNIVRFVDWLPLFYVVGVIAIVLTRKRQRLGDMAARTIVSPIPKKDINPPPAPFLFH